MKRVLAIILSIILLMGTIVNPAYAAQLTEDTAEEAVLEEPKAVPENAEETEAEESSEENAAEEKMEEPAEESTAEPVEDPEEEQTENLTAEPAEVPEEAPEEETVHTTETQVFRTEGEEQSDALLYGYLNKKLAQAGLSVPESYAGEGILAEETADQYLTGNDRIVYDYLREKVAEIAAHGGSTVIDIPMELFGVELNRKYYLSEYGFSDDRPFDDEVDERIKERISFDYNAVINALLFDCPYEMYWYHKTSGTIVNGYSYNKGTYNGKNYIESFSLQSA